ncbi:MAG: glutamine synthetase family protein [Oscillospiraceae bacterium]|nr:glutamine synthetase family protein [Oscillospiraceae bacterium]
MNYTEQEVMEYVRQEDVRFIRLAFCDVFGKQKNISILPDELERAFRHGIAIDASAIPGFGGEVRSDLFLHPDPSTLSSLPWRGENGKVVRMFCGVTHPDGTVLAPDSRALLKKAIERAAAAGVSFAFGAEMEFYLFKTDEDGEPTKIPYDRASYMDIAPMDKGENIRREICITLEQMGIQPECSHHEEGPGQNEIDFRYSDPLSAADNAVTFRSVVETIVARNGLAADFSPKPLPELPGNGMHINLSVKSADGRDLLPYVIAGVMARIAEITAFLNPTDNSYLRLGSRKAPGYISWSSENRSQLIRIPAAHEELHRAELRSADPAVNPYIAYALLIHAGLDGIEAKLPLPPSADVNLFTAPEETLRTFRRLPGSLPEANRLALDSAFVHRCLPEEIIAAYCGR